MSVSLLLAQDRSTCVQLKISPITAALTGLRFADSQWVAHEATGHLAQPPTAPGSVVHTTTAGGFDPADGICTASRHLHGRQRQRHRPGPAATPASLRLPHRGMPCAPPRSGELARPDLVEVSWAQLRAMLAADLQYRMGRLAAGGLPALFADLHPGIRLDGDLVRLATPCDREPISTGGHLVLMPSVLCDRVVLLASDPPHPPLLLYPARTGRAAGLPPAPSTAAVRRLLSGGRLRLLLDLHEPRTADELACRHQMHPQRTRQHLASLASAGLLTPGRQSPAQYERTNLAGVLVSPWCVHCA